MSDPDDHLPTVIYAVGLLLALLAIATSTRWGAGVAGVVLAWLIN